MSKNKVRFYWPYIPPSLGNPIKMESYKHQSLLQLIKSLFIKGTK